MDSVLDSKSLPFKPLIALALCALAYFALVGPRLTTPMVWASITYLTLCIGLIVRPVNTALHARMMLLGIFGDVALVLVLQVSRHAVQTAIAFTLSPLQQAHVVASTVATVLYFPTLYFGFRLWKMRRGSARDVLRRRHLPFAIAAFVFRTAGFALMFSMWDKAGH